MLGGHRVWVGMGGTTSHCNKAVRRVAMPQLAGRCPAQPSTRKCRVQNYSDHAPAMAVSHAAMCETTLANKRHLQLCFVWKLSLGQLRSLTAGEWKDLPGNRFKRKELKKGCVVHLFSGPDEGYTLAKALKTRGYGKRILEIDILRGSDHDMLGDSQVYRGLVRAVLDGKVHAIVGGPNCRSRSVRRHYQPGPRPLRRWNGEEFGLDDLSIEEKAVVHNDDTLLWRLVYLGIVGDFVKRSIDPKDKMIFALEQPEEPNYKPEVVSFWWTREWKSLKTQMDWTEQAFNQGDLVYKPEATPVPPTKFGGNLELWLPKEKNNLAVSRPSGGSGDSKSLARWVPRLMDLVADALCRQAFNEEEIKCKAMTWAEHVPLDTFPSGGIAGFAKRRAPREDLTGRWHTR